MGRQADAGQTDTQAHATVCVAGVILCCVVLIVADDDGFTGPHPIKKRLNKNFKPIEGSGYACGDRKQYVRYISFLSRTEIVLS